MTHARTSPKRMPKFVNLKKGDTYLEVTVTVFLVRVCVLVVCSLAYGIYVHAHHHHTCTHKPTRTSPKHMPKIVSLGISNKSHKVSTKVHRVSLNVKTRI